MARGKKSGAQATATADSVTVQYNSNTIGTLADSGRVTLNCADKRMLSDVEINYTKPAGGETKRIAFAYENIDNVTNQAEEMFPNITYSIDQNGNMLVPMDENDQRTIGDYILPMNTNNGNGYLIPCVYIEADSDLYGVVVNGVHVPYEQIVPREPIYGYKYIITESNYDDLPDSVSIRIVLDK